MPFLDKHVNDWEVIFVCDGCRDDSVENLRSWARESPHNVRVLVSPTNRGKGHAVRRGLLRARGEFRIFTDVDLAYPLDMIEAVAEQIASGDEVVIASRAHQESEVIHARGLEKYLRRRKLKSRAFSLVARTVLHLRYLDAQAGLKGFSARAVRAVMPYLRCQGFGFDCEVLVACKYLGIPVREMPVRVVYSNSESTTRLTNVAGMLRELLAIRARWKSIARNGLDRSVLVTASRLREARKFRRERSRRMARMASAT
jgi:glycosyltransferase involved in cell wall biosynthesis